MPTFHVYSNGQKAEEIVGGNLNALKTACEKYVKASQVFQGTGHTLSGQSVYAQGCCSPLCGKRISAWCDFIDVSSDAAAYTLLLHICHSAKASTAPHVFDQPETAACVACTCATRYCTAVSYCSCLNPA